MAKCLVLGANGFIGSHIVDLLAEDGHFVRCFDRYKTNSVVFANKEDHDVEIVSGDFLNRTSLEKAVEGMDYVFHFISTTTPITSDNDPSIDIDTNIKMSIELFKICSKAGVKRVIFASTGGAIYGNTSTRAPINEDTHPKPVSPYAIGKLTIENYLRYFKTKHDLNYLVMRISNPYGPRQNTLSGQGVIPIFLEKILNDDPIDIYGDGTMVRDYIYVKDVAHLIVEAFDKNLEISDTYNIGSAVGCSVNELVSIIEDVTSKKITKEFKEVPATFIDHVTLDTAKYMNDFKTRPQYELREGILETWKNLKAKK
jgi:UDP-glucose 4-epimerase